MALRARFVAQRATLGASGPSFSDKGPGLGALGPRLRPKGANIGGSGAKIRDRGTQAMVMTL